MPAHVHKFMRLRLWGRCWDHCFQERQSFFAANDLVWDVQGNLLKTKQITNVLHCTCLIPEIITVSWPRVCLRQWKMLQYIFSWSWSLMQSRKLLHAIFRYIFWHIGTNMLLSISWTWRLYAADLNAFMLAHAYMRARTLRRSSSNSGGMSAG